MKANETRVEDFLSANKTQFVIPVYQRNYDWNFVQCGQLLQDILEVGGKQDMTAHFIGSIVYVHDDVYTSSRIKELSIIDGQQRLTTLTLIYLALLHLIKHLGEDELFDEIQETFLINKYASEQEKLKLKPTDNNELALKYLLRAEKTEEFNDFSKLVDNFNYFKERITEENYEYVRLGLSKLMFVEISLDRDKDDPQRIFESLNSTGLELSQSDLIRNYILMGLNREEQNNIYLNYWSIIEAKARDEKSNSSRVSDFIRDYLTLQNKKIPNKGKVYLEFKTKYPVSDLNTLKEHLSELKKLVQHYNKLLNPQNETDVAIRKELKYIQRLETNVAFPFLVQAYDDYVKSVISKSEFLTILKTVQSYVWRRFIVGLPTNALNKVFMNLYEKIDIENYVESCQIALISKTGAAKFPKNSEMIDALRFKDMYNIQSKNRLYCLDQLENYDNTETVNIEENANITIEHIFPQNPASIWKLDLGEQQYQKIKDEYLNTISNLTLSGNNGKLGNKAFIEKRDFDNAGYRDSRLWLNRYLATLEQWTINEINNRFELIADRFTKIWQYPDVTLPEETLNDEVNIFDADEPKGKKLAYAIFMDEKLNIAQVSKLYLEIFSRLFELQPSAFFTTELQEKLAITKNPESQIIRSPQPINDSYYIEANLDSNGKFDRIKLALSILDLEDELFIKYA